MKNIFKNKYKKELSDVKAELKELEDKVIYLIQSEGLGYGDCWDFAYNTLGVEEIIRKRQRESNFTLKMLGEINEDKCKWYSIKLFGHLVLEAFLLRHYPTSQIPTKDLKLKKFWFRIFGVGLGIDRKKTSSCDLKLHFLKPTLNTRGRLYSGVCLEYFNLLETPRHIIYFLPRRKKPSDKLPERTCIYTGKKYTVKDYSKKD